MIPWGLTPARVSILAAAVAGAFAAGGGSVWFLVASPRIELARETGRADLEACKGKNETARADGEAAGRQWITDEIARSRSTEDAYNAEIDRIRREAAARPPRIVRVSCPAGSGPAGAAPGTSAGDPAGPAGAATGGDGSAPAVRGGGIDLDFTGYDAVEATVNLEFAKLRALQERCGP